MVASFWHIEVALFGIPFLLLWYRFSLYWIRQWILPLLFPNARCPRCRYVISLWQYWGSEGGYNDHKVRHVIQFHDNEGNEIRSFKCPRKSCIGSTIQVQKKIDRKLKKGIILGNAFALAPGEARSARMALFVRRFRFWKQNPEGMKLRLGIDRRYRCPLFVRLLRRLCRQPTEKAITIPEAVYGRHMTMFGKSGMGKSKLILGMAQWMFQHGMGATFIDPAGDLANEIIRVVPPERQDDVLWIRVSDRDCPFRLNILETKDEIEEINLNEEVLSALRRMSRSWGENMAHQIDMAIETARLVGGSLKDVHDLFSNSVARNRIVSKIDDLELIEFWEKYERQREQSQAPVKRKLRSIVKHKLLGPMLCSRESNFDADEIIRDHKIVIVDLSTGSTSENTNLILGTFIVSKIMAAAFRQKFVKEQQRSRHMLVIDEAKNFMHKGMNFERIFSEARKYKLSLVLANQHVTQMNDDVRDAAFSNAGVLLSFNVDRDDAKLFAERMPDTTIDDFTMQDVGECIARIHRNSHFIRTQLPTIPEYDPTNYILGRMQAMNGEPSAELSGAETPLPSSENESYDTRYWAPVCEGVR